MKNKAFNFTKKHILYFTIITLVIIAFSVTFFFIFQLKKENKKLTNLIEHNSNDINELSDTLTDITTDDISIYLPEVIYVAKGRTIEIYNNQITSYGSKLSDYYNVTWECEVGKNLSNKFSITATEALIGDYELKFMVYDNYLNLISSVTSTLSIVDDTLNNSYSILNIGDSLSTTNIWYEELIKLSHNKLSFVGTRDFGTFAHEARAGFSAEAYLTETDYSLEDEGVHPFFNTAIQTFDWNYYKETTGINPDIVQIFLGRNSMDVDPTDNVEYISYIVEAIQKDDPNIPIFVVNTIYSGDQNGLGYQQSSHGFTRFPAAFVREEELQVFNLLTALTDKLKNTPNLYFIPLALTHDSANNFEVETITVNPRSNKTEEIHVEAIHPNEAGFLQFADSMFSVYCGILE